MVTKTSWLDESEFVHIESINKTIEIQNIETALSDYDEVYKIGIGDQINIVIWGINDIFPMTNINSDQNLRRVDQNGNIFFPMRGLFKQKEKLRMSSERI